MPPTVYSSRLCVGRHPRNRHRSESYAFPALTAASPELAVFIRPHPLGGETIDFSDPIAVIALNRALLKHDYGVAYWDLPKDALCPPIPGRADYIHHLADLLSEDDQGKIPRGAATMILDIGIGANAIYPLIGHGEYGWRFVGSELEAASLAWARSLVAANPSLAGQIELRLQPSPTAIFDHVTRPTETFAASICNPPFHASADEAAAATARKWKNLGAGKSVEALLNFGGQSHELWCDGGELGFVQRMIAESAQRPALCRWFTTYISKGANLPSIYKSLENASAAEVRTIELINGAKKSRIVCWRFGPAT